jgi:hypothetical protein
MAAWYFDARTVEILDQPATESGIASPPWPNVIFQDRDTGSAHLLPEWTTIDGWERDGARYLVRTTKEIRFFEDCAGQPNDPAQVFSS